MADDPSDHPYSEHRALLGLETPRLIEVGEALIAFDENPGLARRLYEQTLRSVAEARWAKQGLRHLPVADG
jgi:hypothetical protein